MNLYDKYNTVAEEILGISYGEILSNPHKQLKSLLESYDINQMIKIDYCLENMPFDRVVHIINLFLSGKIFFLKLAQNHINKDLSSLLYEWELLALVHDITYIYESKNFSQNYFSLKDVCNDLALMPFFSKENNGIFYSLETYENYFKYKRESFDVCDHGLIAGILFENKFPSKYKIKKTELAYVIASHNIFVANRNNISTYEKYGLQEIIPDSPTFNCIASNKNIYAFYYLIFCLLDILEPVNAFDCLSASEVSNLLNSFDYCIANKTLIINVDNAKQLETIAHRIFDIPIWLKVGLNIESDKKIIITVK